MGRVKSLMTGGTVPSCIIRGYRERHPLNEGAVLGWRQRRNPIGEFAGPPLRYLRQRLVLLFLTLYTKLIFITWIFLLMIFFYFLGPLEIASFDVFGQIAPLYTGDLGHGGLARPPWYTS